MGRKYMKVDDAFVLCCAMRYAMPRHTAAPSVVAEKLFSVYKKIDNHQLYLFIRDIDEALARSDKDDYWLWGVDHCSVGEYTALSNKMKEELRSRVSETEYKQFIRDLEREIDWLRNNGERPGEPPLDLKRTVEALASMITSSADKLKVDAEEMIRLVSAHIAGNGGKG